MWRTPGVGGEVATALLGAGITVAATLAGVFGVAAAIGAATACFLVRMLGVKFDLNAPQPPESQPPP